DAPLLTRRLAPGWAPCLAVSTPGLAMGGGRRLDRRLAMALARSLVLDITWCPPPALTRRLTRSLAAWRLTRGSNQRRTPRLAPRLAPRLIRHQTHRRTRRLDQALGQRQTLDLPHRTTSCLPRCTARCPAVARAPDPL